MCPGNVLSRRLRRPGPAGSQLLGGTAGSGRPVRSALTCPLSPGCLVDRTGKILVPGISQAVAPVTQEELELYDKIDFDLEEYAQDVGTDALLHGCKVGPVTRVRDPGGAEGRPGLRCPMCASPRDADPEQDAQAEAGRRGGGRSALSAQEPAGCQGALVAATPARVCGGRSPRTALETGGGSLTEP